MGASARSRPRARLSRRPTRSSPPCRPHASTTRGRPRGTSAGLAGRRAPRSRQASDPSVFGCACRRPGRQRRPALPRRLDRRLSCAGTRVHVCTRVERLDLEGRQPSTSLLRYHAPRKRRSSTAHRLGAWGPSPAPSGCALHTEQQGQYQDRTRRAHTRKGVRSS
eukprot:3198470-Prymnesium_polylepis.1